MSADDVLRKANWARMKAAIERAAVEFERTAAELRGIDFVRSNGQHRSPESIISQAALVAESGRTYSDLMHRLAIWAESINDCDRHSQEEV